MPARQFIGFANNHSIHHRGQLAAYLRADGLEGADHLRRQRGRADEAAASSECRFPISARSSTHLRRDGDIVTVEAPVDPHLEVAEIHRRVIAAGGPALLFTNVKGSRLPARHQPVRHRRGAPSWRSASGRCG